MHRLLILACSQRKSPVRKALPAIERYDGPAFRVLRKFLLEAPEDAPQILILSARYGLIDSAKPIRDYDCRMTAARAERHNPAALEDLRRILRARHWGAIGLCVGKDYWAALDGLGQLLPEDTPVAVLGGGLGRRLTNLHRWLRSSAQLDARTGARREEANAD
jgi:hypothetical protein